MAFAPPPAKHLLEHSVKTKCPECGAEFRVCSHCGSVVEGPYKVGGDEREAIEKIKELREKGFKVFIHPKGI